MGLNAKTTFSSILLAVIIFCAKVGRADVTATPIDPGQLNQAPFVYVGLFTSRSPEDYNTSSVCSASVVKHPKILLSAAHCVYKKVNEVGHYVLDTKWISRWNQSGMPGSDGMQVIPGYWYFSSYAPAVDATSFNSIDAFAWDIIAAYSYENLNSGYCAGSWSDGVVLLDDGRSKLIVGYPSGNYQQYDPSKFLMHLTGPFTQAFKRVNGNYFQIEGVATGKGNSGGPVYVEDKGTYYFAGVVVSGLAVVGGDLVNRAGVRAIEENSWKLVSDAIASADSHVVVSLTPTPIPTQPPNLSEPSLMVSCNDVDIDSDDMSPSYQDGTNFGVLGQKRKYVDRKFFLYNDGEQRLVIRSVALKKKTEFSIIKRPSGGLGAFRSSPLVIRFRPTRRGSYSTLVSITSNDSMTPKYTFKISGKK